MHMMKSILKNSQNRKISAKKSTACHIGKQTMLQSWRHQNTVTLVVSPEGIQDRNQKPTIQQSESAATPKGVP